MVVIRRTDRRLKLTFLNYQVLVKVNDQVLKVLFLILQSVLEDYF